MGAKQTILVLVALCALAAAQGCSSIGKLHTHEVIHDPGGHEQIWFNGVSMNGNASWVVVGVVTMLILIAGFTGNLD